MNAMKVITIIFLLGIYSVFSQRNTNDSVVTTPPVNITPKEDREVNLHLQEQIIKSLKNELKYKLDSLSVSSKVKRIYMKVYVAKYVKIYVPIVDSSFLLTADTLKNVYLDSIRIKKRGILKKLLK